MTKKEVSKNKKTIDKIVNIALISFMVVMLASSLFFTYARMQNKLVNFFGYSVCYVLTGSMEPYLTPGDVIIIKDVPVEEILVGDIVTYKSTSGALAGNYVTHRVIEKINLGNVVQFKTQGDANQAADTEFITYEKIVGKFQNKLFVLGFIINSLSNGIVFFILVILPLLLLFISHIVGMVTTLKENKEEETEEENELNKIYGNEQIEEYIKNNEKKL